MSGQLLEFIKVARLDDIKKHGWIKSNLMGREIVVMYNDKRCLAFELSRYGQPLSQYAMFDDLNVSNTKIKDLIDGLFAGPNGQNWGRLRDYPVRIEGEFVYVGIDSSSPADI